MLKITQKQAQYLKINFRKFSDKRLAKALKKDKSWVKKALSELNLERSKEDISYIQKHPTKAPPYFEDVDYIPVFCQPKISLKEKLILSLSFFIPFCAYVFTLSHFPVGKNGAELAVCVYSWGIPSSPACPLYLLLAKFFSLIPFGEFGFKLNLYSAFMGAGVCLILSHILYFLFRSLTTAVILSLFLAFCSPFWKLSISTSVWTQALFFFALSLYFAIHWQRTQNERMYVLFIIASCATLTTHPVFILFLPVFLFLLIKNLKNKILSKSLLIGSVMLGLILLSLFLYIPIASLESSFFRGNVEIFGNVFANPEFFEIFKMAWFWPSLKSSWLYVLSSLGFLLTLYGVKSFYDDKALFGLFASTFICACLPILFSSSNIIFLPTLFITLIFTGTVVSKSLSSHKRSIQALSFSFILLFLLSCIYSHRISYKNYTFPKTYAKIVSKNIKDKAVLIPGSNLSLAYLLYGKSIGAIAKSVHILNPYGKDREFNYLPFLLDEKLLTKIIQRYPQRNYFLTHTSNQLWHNYSLQRIGLVWKVTSLSFGGVLQTEKKQKYPDFTSPSIKFSYQENKLISQCHYLKGIDLLKQGKIKPALGTFVKATFHKEETTKLVTSHAKRLAALRKYAQAVQLFTTIENKNIEVWLSLARIEMQRNGKNVEEYYKAALKQNNKHFNALVELARWFEKKKKWQKAQDAYEKLIKHYPNISYPYRKLAQLLAKKRGNRKKVHELLSKAKEIDERLKNFQQATVPSPKIPGKVGIVHKVPQVPKAHINVPNLPNSQVNTPKVQQKNSIPKVTYPGKKK